MKINITARNSRITKSLTAYINEKFSKCQKYFSNILSIDVILSQQKYLYSVEAIINISGQTIRVNQQSANYRSAIDLTVDKIDRQLKKQKEKLKTHHRNTKNLIQEDYARVDELLLNLNKKEFFPESMSIEEAKTSMDRYSYMFWVFNNKKTSKLSVLYRRDDLTYGLIEIRKRR